MWVTKVKNSPYWHARFPHPDGSGAIVSLTTKCAKRREAVARARDLKAEFTAEWRDSEAGGTISSKSVIDQYWETEAKLLKAAVTHIFPHLNRIDQHLGIKPYCMVTIADVAAFADKMQAEGFSPSTINRALSVWRRMHNVAGKVRLFPVKVIDWSKVRKTEPPPRDAHLTPAQLTTIFQSLPQSGREIAMFGLLTGLRKSQVLTLSWDRVNLDDATVTVFRKHRKREARHTVPIHDAALRIVIQRRPLANGDLVFDPINFRKQWEGALTKAGLRGEVRFHDLRHAFATAAAKTTPLHVLQEMMGHSTIALTQRYSHARASDMRDALKRLPVIDVTAGKE